MECVRASEERFLGLSDAMTVQAAVDYAAGQGGGTVVIPRLNARTGKPEWRFDRAVILKSAVKVVLENAFVVQEPDAFSPLFTAEAGARNAALLGEGNALLSGGGKSRLKVTTSGLYGMPKIEHNVLLNFRGVSGLSVRNLEFEEFHWFAILLEGVSSGTLENLRFQSYPRVPEEGGILIRSGCKNLRIENLTGRTGHHTVELSAEHGPIEDVRIRNLMTDPARGSLVMLCTGEGGTIRNVSIDRAVDSSDFYEKQRSGSVLAFGKPGQDSGREARIFGITAENLYSRSVNAVELNEPVSGLRVQNLMTFGDNIYAVGSKSTGPILLSDAVIDGICYGAGSEPNNSASFISRYAKGAKPVQAENVSGLKVRRLLTQEEEA